MLRDIEVLILQIVSSDSREYFEEAYRCYKASAYRGAVVLAVSAGIDDLWRRLEELRTSQNVSINWKKQAAHISTLISDHNAYESDVLSLAGGHANILSSGQVQKLELVLKTRHLCAHPTGHVGSAEEARDALTTILDLILTKPMLGGIAALDQLLERVKTVKGFFPDGETDTTRTVVSQEIEKLHSKIRPQVIRRLVASLRDTLVREEQERLGVFLHGLVLQDSPDLLISLREPIVNQTLIETPHGQRSFMKCIVSRPSILELFDPIQRSRYLYVLFTNLGTGPALSAMVALLIKKILVSDEINQLHNNIKTNYFNASSNEQVQLNSRIVFGMPIAFLQKEFIEMLVRNAGSSNYRLTNAAVTAMQELSPEQAILASPEQMSNYVVNISEAARWGAYKAKNLVVNGLGQRAGFIDSFKNHVDAGDFMGNLDKVGDFDVLARLLISSNRADVLELIFERAIRLEDFKDVKHVRSAVAVAVDTAKLSDATSLKHAAQELDGRYERLRQIIEDSE